MEIRESTHADLAAVLDIETRAFGGAKGSEIAGLVEGLLADPSAKPLLSLVALDGPRPVGHILFTKARIEPAAPPVSASILAPLAVVPEAQGRGVGTKLVRRGHDLLAERGVELVFVLGHPSYYPQHGFSPAGALGFEATYPIAEKDANAWMVKELRAGTLGSARGRVVCADALDRPEYWRE